MCLILLSSYKTQQQKSSKKQHEQQRHKNNVQEKAAATTKNNRWHQKQQNQPSENARWARRLRVAETLVAEQKSAGCGGGNAQEKLQEGREIQLGVQLSSQSTSG